MNELNNPYAELLRDFDIIREHKHEFLQPLWIIMELTSLHLPEAELIKNEDFKKAVSQMKEIDRQGYRSQFIAFVNIVMGADF